MAWPVMAVDAIHLPPDATVFGSLSVGEQSDLTFFIRVFDFGPRVSWLAFVAMIFAIALVYALRPKQGRWRDVKALERVMAE